MHTPLIPPAQPDWRARYAARSRIVSCSLTSLCVVLIAPYALAQFDVEAATRAYVDGLTGEELASSNRYFEGGYWLIAWSALITALVDLFFLQSRLSKRLADWARRVTDRTWLQPGLFALPYQILGFLLTAPWVIYTDFIRERNYGLLSQTFGAWFGEQVISIAVSLVLFSLFIMALFAVIRRAPRTWWLWGTGVATACLFILIMLAPIFIAPLFNDYEEMPPSPIRDRIVAMAEEHNVPAERIYVFNQSKQHKRISANVSGMGPTIRVSLNDNLLERTTPEEIAAVMGHELGHYVLGHTWRLFIGLSFLLGLALFLVARIAPRLIDRNRDRWGVSDIADPAAAPVMSLLLTLIFFVATPALNTLIRVNESEADLFGLNVAQEPDGFARVAMRLSEYRKIEPGPIEEILFFDHPAGITRVRMSMQWKLEHEQQPTEGLPSEQ